MSTDSGAQGDPSDVDYWLQQLVATPRARALALQALSHLPIPDQRLLTACEHLLDDSTMTLLGIPYVFGEVRWCAADAVAALRSSLGLSTPVVLHDVFAPATTTQVGALAKEAGLTSKAGIDGVLEVLWRSSKRLRDSDNCHGAPSPEHPSNAV